MKVKKRNKIFLKAIMLVTYCILTTNVEAISLGFFLIFGDPRLTLNFNVQMLSSALCLTFAGGLPCRLSVPYLCR